MNKDLIVTLLYPNCHDRRAFDCGEPALNEYLRNTAHRHLLKGIANTYVLVSRAEPEKILGFFTLSFLEVDLSEIPSGHSKKLRRSRLPAAKLGRLAIDKSCQGNNYSRLLLAGALLRVANAIRNAAGIVGLFVDAKDSDVAAFYQKFCFIPLGDNPLSLMLPNQTILGAIPDIAE
jgi:predicted GNAT family N-acyltransferase